MLEPKNPDVFNVLAYFLIDKDININKGLALADKAMNKSSNNYNYIGTKGWGLYKLRRYEEALELIQKSWDIILKTALYNHELHLHLQAAKKAVSEQRKN